MDLVAHPVGETGEERKGQERLEMGTDWCRMRPRQGIAQAELVRLIELQATSFQAIPSWWSTDPISEGEPDEEAKRLYSESSAALREALEMGEDTDDFRVCCRVYPITRNPVFPPEWRLHAHRTYLPEELPHQLARWQTYLSAVQQGQHRPYLQALYLAEASLALYERWRELVELATRSVPLTTAWTTKPALIAMREAIFQLAPLPLYPTPLWATWQAVERVDSATQERYEQHRQQVEVNRQVTFRWNRCVPSSWKLQRWFGGTFEEFLVYEDRDEWVSEFFAWAERCCAEQMGLYLD